MNANTLPISHSSHTWHVNHLALLHLQVWHYHHPASTRIYNLQTHNYVQQNSQTDNAYPYYPEFLPDMTISPSAIIQRHITSCLIVPPARQFAELDVLFVSFPAFENVVFFCVPLTPRHTSLESPGAKPLYSPALQSSPTHGFHLAILAGLSPKPSMRPSHVSAELYVLV